ncbi:hypothetical protein BGZ60DRAFT_420076 [Tricladium varicosporioides]|nr:hypothetical protein BGZ60DRAFT_420076 [Hymenoscyphus varicosporioides]
MIEREKEKWDHQLKGVCPRLEALILRCQELTICLESLQERVKGMLSIVNILLAEKENEYSRTSDAMRQEREAFQIEMLKHQQDIAIRAKRDNTVMKVIAVLSALFLPGTLIAQIFAIPTFHWGEDQIFGRHFMVYWDFTIPITATLVIGFSAWFIKVYLDDKKKEAADIRNRIKDQERDVDSTSISEKGSLILGRTRSP